MRCFSVGLGNLIRVTFLNKEHHVPPKKHITRYTTEYILYAITEGELHINHNGEDMHLVPGDICLMNKGEYQFPLSITECKYIYLHFEASTFDEYDISEKQYCDMVLKNKKDYYHENIYSASSYDNIRALIAQKFHINDLGQFEYMVSILEKSILSHENNSPKHRMEISHSVADLFLMLESICVKQIESAFVKVGKGYATVDKIEEYIRKNYTANFHGTDIENLFFINFDYINRLFKKQVGYNIFKYRNILRVNAAKEKIRMSDKSLYEISSELGFGEISYFSRVFKNHEGISPDKYRDLVRGIDK